MSRIKHDLGLRLTKILNVILIALPFAFCWYSFYASRIAAPYKEYGNIGIICVFVILYIIFARVYDAFLISQNRISEMVTSQLLSFLFSDCIVFLVIWLLTYSFPNPLPMLATVGCQIVLSLIWCIVAHKGYYAMVKPKRSAIVYDEHCEISPLFKEYGLEKKFKVEATVSIEECITSPEVLDEFDTLFICGVHSHERNKLLKYCIANNIEAYVMPRIGDIIMGGAQKIHMFHLPMLKVNRCTPHPEYIFVKRIFDILSASVVLLAASPFMLITALAIKLTDGGPVFYKQKRLTKNGKEFNILKFRSMRVDAEKDGIARLSTGDKDDRITPVGRFIRKCRIDELPQLLNIISGNMSVVGPRPERPEISAQYEEELPEFRLRLQVKAGLTGYAQVYGKYNTTPYDKLQMDLMYIAKPGLIADLRIIFATIKILFAPESTDGVAQGQVTAMGNKEPINK